LVEIKSIAREAGSRSKISVHSVEEGIDSVGACVGPRGIRVQNIVNELNGEKIDIIKYSKDPEKFIANALSPSKVIMVDVNEAEKKARSLFPIINCRWPLARKDRMHGWQPNLPLEDRYQE
jgi:N utilization substance protein A